MDPQNQIFLCSRLMAPPRLHQTQISLDEMKTKQLFRRVWYKWKQRKAIYSLASKQLYMKETHPRSKREKSRSCVDPNIKQ